MRDRVAYRVAQLRELASLGVWSAKAAGLLGLTKPRVHQLCIQYGIGMPRHTGRRPIVDHRVARAA